MREGNPEGCIKYYEEEEGDDVIVWLLLR